MPWQTEPSSRPALDALITGLLNVLVEVGDQALQSVNVLRHVGDRNRRVVLHLQAHRAAQLLLDLLELAAHAQVQRALDSDT